MILVMILKTPIDKINFNRKQWSSAILNIYQNVYMLLKKFYFFSLTFPLGGIFLKYMQTKWIHAGKIKVETSYLIKVESWKCSV